MIPQFLHWIFPYRAELGYDQKRVLCSWREHHPSWRPMIWASDPAAVAVVMAEFDYEVRALPLLVNHRLYSLLGCHDDQARQQNYPHDARAIVASIEIMARYGGICPPVGEPCDCNIESLLQGVRLFTRDDVPSHEENGETPSALTQTTLPLYGAMPNHPALWNVVSDLRNSALKARPQSGAVCAAALRELVLFRLGRHPDSVNFPAAAFEVNHV